MKISFGTRVVGLALMASLACAGRAAAEGEPRAATVLNLRGQARASSDHTTWHKLANGSAVWPGTLIQTAENTTLDIVLAKSLTHLPPGAAPDKKDTGIIHIMGNSVFSIDKLSSEHVGDELVEDVELNLQVGEISGIAGKPAAASKYEMKFTKGVIGIRGCTYSLTASGLLTVLTGEAVAVSAGADGSTQVKVVTSGNQFDANTGTISPIPPAADSVIHTVPSDQSPAPQPSPNKPENRPVRPF